MYKWHVHSAIGRGRPIGHDISRVADGIAASLRHFSMSVSRAAEGDDQPKVSRTQRSADAAKEVSSLPRRAAPRGVDARSLAAKPPQGLKITRVMMDGPPPTERTGQRNLGPRPRGGAAPRAGRGGRGGRGGFGARAGRGGRGGRGRGKGRKQGNTRDNNAEEEDEDVFPPLEKEEQPWFEGFESGFEMPYNPSTNLDHLRRSGASVMPPSSPMGVVESVAYKFQVATSMVAGHDTHAAVHLEKIRRGDGSIFETPESKAIAQGYYDQIRQADADAAADREGRERKPVKPRALPTLDTLPESVRYELAKAWVAGHYTKPKAADIGDILGTVGAYAAMNGSYLPHSKKSLEDKLRTLLPAAYQKPQTGNASGQKAT